MMREALAQEATTREAEARETAAREAQAHEEALRAEEAHHASDPEPEDGPSPAANFPVPRFPRDVIEALGTLDLGLPPRQEARPAAAAPEPAIPQPIAEPHVPEHRDAPSSAAEDIESGITGAASVAGLGASRFPPLSLDFDLGAPASQTAPLPAFTPEQIATIARNKLELAVEYIELGDLSGARTLLEEVIESNDHGTRQQAAALLSTLAPHS
jgi:pilus assembly protein FimV